MPRRSLSAVEECYRDRQVRVFRLERDTILRELESRARRLLAERPEVLEVRLFGSLMFSAPDRHARQVREHGDRSGRSRPTTVFAQSKLPDISGSIVTPVAGHG
jgi:hypothetical protein